ncbi:hypothetical protein GOV04_04095 [Candidatus Woesearchaeota archaeon]|nr:hypothetical protein [Candidatus Woesearchaeota archaeon]
MKNSGLFFVPQVFSGPSRKRGSLSLSINAIVVLILAITMLGLGLGFMRKSFGGVAGQFEQVTDEMQQEMANRLKGTTQKIAFNAESIRMESSEKKRGVFIGVKNIDADSDTFFISFDCVQQISDSGACDTAEEPDIQWFDNQEIDGGKVEVLPVTIIPQAAKDETYKFTVTVCALSNTAISSVGDCNDLTDDNDVYARNNLFIDIDP